MDFQLDSKAKLRKQIDLQQTEEELRKLGNEMATLEVQIRQYEQEFNHANINLQTAKAKKRGLESKKFELDQRHLSQKKALLDFISGRER